MECLWCKNNVGTLENGLCNVCLESGVKLSEPQTAIPLERPVIPHIDCENEVKNKYPSAKRWYGGKYGVVVEIETDDAVWKFHSETEKRCWEKAYLKLCAV